MTKKDFENVAWQLKTRRIAVVNSESMGPESLAMLDGLIRDLADVFAANYPRFDRERFLAACRGEKWTKKRDGKHQNSWQSGMVHGEASR